MKENTLQLFPKSNTTGIGWIIKARGDLLYLYQSAFLKEGTTECSMCNLHLTLYWGLSSTERVQGTTFKSKQVIRRFI